jgi:hypothetical protein
MRRILAIAIFILTICALPAAAQSLPSAKDASVLVAKAQEQKRLTGPGATPFHILAKIHFTVGKASIDGAYEVLWESADRYREEFRLGSLSATYLALQDKQYIRRNTPALTYPQWRVRMLMGFPSYTYDVPKPDIVKVYQSQIGSEDVICADVKFAGTRCFSHAGEIVSSEWKSTQGKPMIARLGEDSFVDIGEARFPSHILSTISDETLEVRLEKVELVTHFADATFVPPDGASAYDWCAQPEVGTQPKDSRFVPMTFVGGQLFQGPLFLAAPAFSFKVSALYVQTGADGHIEKMMETYPDGSAKDLMTKMVRESRLPIHSCAGKPIEFEEIIGSAIQIDPNAKILLSVGHDSGP